MFNEVPFMERFGAAAEAGFKGVEFLSPYGYPVAAIEELLNKHQVKNVLFSLPPGDFASGERGIACLPGREAEFRDSVDVAISYATRLGTPSLHVLAGIVDPGADHTALSETYFKNLRYASEKLAPHNINLLIEAINPRDMPNYFLRTPAQAFEICSSLDLKNLKMQLDLYHMQITEGDLETGLRRYLPSYRHVQIAGVPARNEPDRGEINCLYLMEVLDEIGYDGWVGCEYRPRRGTREGLGWFSAFM
jgi:hydroxypyruvate isomerase